MSDFGWLCWLAGCAGVCGWGHVAQRGFSTSRSAGLKAQPNSPHPVHPNGA